MQTQTTLDMTRQAIRRRAENAVAEFASDVALNGIAHAISWSSVPAIVAEMVLADLTRFETALAEVGLDRAIEGAEQVRASHAQLAGYFDPTSHSTSASSTMVEAAKFKGHRAVVDMIDDLTGSHALDVEG